MGGLHDMPGIVLAGISLSLPFAIQKHSPLTFLPAFLTLTNSSQWLGVMAKSLMMNLIMINNNIQLQPPFTACLLNVKSYLSIFSYIILLNPPYN